MLMLSTALTFQAAAAQKAGPDRRYSEPLARFLSIPGPVRLLDESSRTDLSIPLAPAATLEDASIELHYTNSIALQPNRSAILVRFNETTLAQIRLDPAQPNGVATVRLPRELWHPGYNKLTLAVVQHYVDQCEDPQAPELWTELDMGRSTLTYSLGEAGRSDRVSDLSGIFAPGLGGIDKVLMLTSPSAAADHLRASALPLVAEALALRRRYAPLSVEHRRWREPPQESRAGYLPEDAPSGMAQVIVGTPEQLSHILPATDQIVTDGPMVTIKPLAGGLLRLIVTGRTDDEIIKAAQGLAVMEDSLEANAEVTYLGSREGGSQPLRENSLQAGRSYDFHSLGVDDTVISGLGTGALEVILPLSADFYTFESAQAELSLDFAYGAGLGSGSVLNISLNGEMIHGTLLGARDGQSFHDYRIQLPARLLTPGNNKLRFDVNLRLPEGTAACSRSKGRELFVQFFGSSLITMPAAGNAAVLPDLSKFAASGFPFVTEADKTPSKIIATSEDLLGSALTLAGKLAQQAHGPIRSLSLQTGIPAQPVAGSAIVLAPLDRLKPELFGQWVVIIGRATTWPYKSFSDLRQRQSGHIDLMSLLPGKESPADQSLSRITQRAYTGDMGILATYRNPDSSATDTLMVITAENDATLAKRVDDLVKPELWGQMRGDLVTWTGIDAPMTVAQVGEHYQVGAANRWLLLRLIVSNNPWYWLGAVLFCLVIVSGASVFLLYRRRHRLGKGADR